MLYLVVQISAFLLLAAAIGAALGWWWRGVRTAGGGAEAGHESPALERARAAARQVRGELTTATERLQRAEQELANRAREVTELRTRLMAVERQEPVLVTPRPAKLAIAVDEAPEETAVDGAAAAAGTPAAASEDLTVIRGIGKATAAVLRQLGYSTVEHIAAWEQADLERVVAAKSALKGRIERDRWVEQARAIIAKR